jgi:FKBP-type peptidyl-prolyl cis-trans isomerase
MKLFFYLSLLFTLLMLSCSKEKSIQEQIDDYIKANNLQAKSNADGLYYVIEDPGSNEKPNLNSTVTVDYLGTLINGKKFDSSFDRGESAVFPLKDVIKGWQIGIPLFGRGGKGKLIVPPHLAYGSRATSTIPANSILVFDVIVHDFK